MTENSYSMRDIKVQHLHNVYKRYTDFIINFEKHMEKLYNDWVIDVNSRNIVLQQLDNIVRKMIKIYNMNKLRIYKEYDMLTDVDGSQSVSQLNVTIKKSDYENIYKNLYNAIDIINMVDDKKIINLINGNPDDNNPFSELRTELLDIGFINGFLSMEEFFHIYINEYYHYLFNKNDLEIFNIYNKVFVPFNVKIEQIKNNDIDKSSPIITIAPITSKCDSLIDNTVSITIRLDSLGVIAVFEGYVSADTLNVYVRTSQIYSKYIFSVKKTIDDQLKMPIKTSSNSNYNPNQMDQSFEARYLKIINSNAYFVYPPAEFIDRMHEHYRLYLDLTSKGFNMVMKDFIHSDVKNMFNIINLLLLGTEQTISTGVLLFNLLKDRKASGETLTDIIYHNLSYYAQIKLKKVSNNMKAELNRIKSLTPENVSIEKKLASLVNMPDNVKSLHFRKSN